MKISEKKIERKYAIIEANREARAKRSPQEQLALLNKRLGKGKGAQRERAKLAKQIAENAA